MKKIYYSISKSINWFLVVFFVRNINSQKSSFFSTKIKIESGNQANLFNSAIFKSHLAINGSSNTFQSDTALISNSIISIQGENNRIILEPNVNLRNANIIVRGQNCMIRIGRKTSTGGVRIVNVGKDNVITIGKGCLLSDNIEIWASDTHKILNEAGETINKEKPIRIGDHVWIGAHVSILKGVTIGHHSIIGMGSIVTKDVEEKTLNVGNPCRELKKGVTWKLEY